MAKDSKIVQRHLDLFPTPVTQYNLSYLDTDKILEILKKFEVGPHGILDGSDSSYGKDLSILDDKELKFLKDEIDKCLNEYIERVQLQNIIITGSWYNNMSLGSRLHPHRHEGSVLSGAFYLKANDNTVPLVLKSPLLPYKMNDLYKATDNQYSSSGIGIQPIKGFLVIFPSWIEHQTNPEQGERCLISFNTFYK